MKNLIDIIKKYEPYNEQELRDKEVILKYTNTFENLLTRDNEFAHFSASAWVVNKERTKVLMVYHNIYKSWSWAGGHADGEEDLTSVVLKEVKEETGLTNLRLVTDKILGLQILTVNGHVKRGKYVSGHLHLDCCFLIEADENEAIRIKEDENSGIKWININQVLELTNESQMKPIYSKLNEKVEKFYS